MPARKITMANGKNRQALMMMMHSIASHRSAKPVRHVGTIDDAKRDQRPVEHAVERIEQPSPGNGGKRDRYDERQNDQRPDDLAAGERPQQQEGAELAEHEAEQLRAERKDEGIDQRSG